MKNETEQGNEPKEQVAGPGDETGEITDEDSKIRERINGLERKISEKDTEISTLEKSREELENRCKALGDSLSDAVTRYRTIVVRNNPEIPVEMITGDTIDDVNESLERSKDLVNRIRQGLETEVTRIKVPPGAPERITPDLSALSPGEKIRYALGGKE
ncbi:MAG: hypothetical protein JW712_04595 [Dehalococcoidales bacterium]|nr:hypothetical protein [Dehalococcoidales bacterium]